jgi:hydroxyacylglutathione hydrolase
MPIQIRTLPLGDLQANGYIIADDEAPDALAIDPGGEAQRMAAVMAQLKKHLTHILLTHAHFDHVGGVADLAEATGAIVALHSGDLPLLRRRGDAREFGYNIRPCPEPGLLIQGGQILELGSMRLEALFVPGHTPGHLAFYLPQAEAVFTGDVLFKEGIGRTDLPGGDYDMLMRSIREVLFRLPDNTVVYPGHGPSTTIGDEKQFNPFLA